MQQQASLPNRETFKLIRDIQADSAFVVEYASKVFNQNQVELKEEMKEATSDLISQLKKLLDVIPK